MKTLIPTLVITLTLGTFAIGAPPPEDLLAGPNMTQEEVTDDDMLSRKLQETGKKHKPNARKQQRMWMSALESVELTHEQKVEIKALLSELKEAQLTFHATHGKEVAAIQKEHRAAKKKDIVLSDDSRKRSMELMGLAPDVTVYQEKAWVLLNEDQKKTFQTTYQSLLDEESKRREENKGKDRSQKKDNKTRGFGPEDSMIDNRGSLEGTINHYGDSVDDASYRRIKFLRRLQELDN